MSGICLEYLFLLQDQTSLYNGVANHGNGAGDGKQTKSGKLNDGMDESGTPGDKVSGGNCSSGSSGWDCIDEKETQITRWVPDHASPCCTLCSQQFSVSNRKHHCRFVLDPCHFVSIRIAAQLRRMFSFRSIQTTFSVLSLSLCFLFFFIWNFLV